jgi:predicted SAM-dependent methyltransferase
MFEIPPNTLPGDAVRLCLGSGSNPLKDFVNLDFFSDLPEVISCDLRRLPYEDNSVDEIFALQPEHIPHPEVLTVFRDWLRVLKPGGKISLNAPDIVWVFKKWIDLPEEEKWGYYLGPIYGLQNNATEVHYTCFTPERMRSLLETAGFADIEIEIKTQFSHQRIWAFATKPLESPTYDEAHFGCVLPEAMQMTKMIFEKKLPETDYNWLKREAEYDELKLSMAQYQDNLLDLRKMSEELQAIVEQKESVIKLHIDMVNEKIAENAQLASENERLKCLLDAHQDAQSDCKPFKVVRGFISRLTKGADATRT